MDAVLAKEILTVAREGGYFEEEIPNTDAQAIETGTYFLDEARKARAAGMDDDAIVRIVELGAGSVPAESPAEEEQVPQTEAETVVPVADAAEEVQEGGRPEFHEAAPVPADDTSSEADRSGGEAGSSSAGAPRGEKLPVPAEIEGDASPMPRDLTALNDREVRRQHGENNAFFARASWLVSIAASDLRSSEHMAAHALRKAIGGIDPVDADGKKRTKAAIEAMAAEDAEYLTWCDRARKHEAELDQLKALREIYKANVAALSREASMRSDEFARAGGK